MAKKKHVAPSRACESCSTQYHPRSKACPKCGKANPKIDLARRERKKVVAHGGAIDEAIRFVEESGGLRDAVAAMRKVEEIQALPA